MEFESLTHLALSDEYKGLYKELKSLEKAITDLKLNQNIMFRHFMLETEVLILVNTIEQEKVKSIRSSD